MRRMLSLLAPSQSSTRRAASMIASRLSGGRARFVRACSHGGSGMSSLVWLGLAHLTRTLYRC